MKIIIKKEIYKKNAFVSMFAIFFSAIVISILTAMYVLLIKQIELMTLDSSSFQSFYMADSAFECVLYKEQNASSTNSIFQPSHSAGLGYCATAGDATWASSPIISSGRSNSILNISLTTTLGNFCGVVTVGKQVDNSEISNTMNISGQSRACTDTISKIIERVVDFYY